MSFVRSFKRRFCSLSRPGGLIAVFFLVLIFNLVAGPQLPQSNPNPMTGSNSMKAKLGGLFEEPRRIDGHIKRRRNSARVGLPSRRSSLLSPAILVIAYNRPHYLNQSLQSLFRLPEVDQFTVYLSQDGSEPDLSTVVKPYEGRLTIMHNKREPLLAPHQSGTAYIAQHYKFALSKVFNDFNHSHAIIIEEDLVLSPDFLEYFLYTAPLLDLDPTLFCISSWHDNGMNWLVRDESRIFRTSFFPGLGWMLKQSFWREIEPEFPLDQWDKLMHLDTIRKGRDCLAPEISRNRNIGEEGTNMVGGFFPEFLEPSAFQAEPRKRPFQPLETLTQAEYDRALASDIRGARLIGSLSDASTIGKVQLIRPAMRESDSFSFLVLYERPQWHQVILSTGVLPTVRAIYRGVVMFRRGWHKIFFADIKLAGSILHPAHQWKSTNCNEIVSEENESCDSACARSNLRCAPEHFQFLNECSVLKRHFPCEKGCRAGIWGSNAPNYVSSMKKPELHQHCLTTQTDPVCDAHHRAVKRLCPCMDK